MNAATPVFGTFTQAELNRQYDAAATVPSVDVYFERYAALSALTRTRLNCELDVAYGQGERERVDLFPAARPDSPLFVFIHGGYWRRLDKSYFSFVAEPLVRAGAAVACLNYPLAPSASLDRIVRSARAALDWFAANTQRLNAGAQRIVLGGHSAGGQLAGLLGGRPPFTGIFTLSGLFDLAPVRLSHVNDWMRLDAAAAERNSPSRHLPETTATLVAAVGALETDEFKRQTESYVQAWRARRYPAEALVLNGLNHFSIVLELADERSALSVALHTLIFV
ncbi:MAG TPA: alpha/beta hydrolase [Candidatus Baltobacteraceae bacterium]|nr:alpha/beta hydrolase [Candidatus Baltobacteraceae bacterium]